jgi:hypothetical protein
LIKYGMFVHSSNLLTITSEIDCCLLKRVLMNLT